MIYSNKDVVLVYKCQVCGGSFSGGHFYTGKTYTGTTPPKTPTQKIKELEAEIERLKKQIKEEK